MGVRALAYNARFDDGVTGYARDSMAKPVRPARKHFSMKIDASAGTARPARDDGFARTWRRCQLFWQRMEHETQ
jgi:hypothetical protein